MTRLIPAHGADFSRPVSTWAPATGGPGAGVVRHAVGLVRNGIGLHAGAEPVRARTTAQRRLHGDISMPPRLPVERAPDVRPNVEQTWVEQASSDDGYGSAYGRMCWRRPSRSVPAG